VGISNPRIETSALVEIKQQDGGFTITSSHLTVKIAAQGADKAAVQKAAESAEKNCPVSKLLKAEITMETAIEV
jgi:osmotically inducible protein OsmC